MTDRLIVLSNPEEVKKLLNIMESDVPEDPTPRHRTTDEEQKRGEELFRRCVERSRIKRMENKNQKDTKMKELRKELQQVEADREVGKSGCTLDELEEYLDDILEEK